MYDKKISADIFNPILLKMYANYRVYKIIQCEWYFILASGFLALKFDNATIYVQIRNWSHKTL